MKIKTIKHEAKFNPITLEITFESQSELDFFKYLFANMSMNQAKSIAGIEHPDMDLLSNIYLELSNFY